MIKALKTVAAGAGTLAVMLALSAGSATALSTKECSTKYQAAKDGGTLAGKTWNQFRKDDCGADAAAAPAKPVETKQATKAPDKPVVAPKTEASGGAVFPSAISAKFASQTPSKQRFHTCLEQYNANKTGSGNGGLKWIQKGGGYYSQCNARLKQ
jgi:hypothetical protein